MIGLCFVFTSYKEFPLITSEPLLWDTPIKWKPPLRGHLQVPAGKTLI